MRHFDDSHFRHWQAKPKSSYLSELFIVLDCVKKQPGRTLDIPPCRNPIRGFAIPGSAADPVPQTTKADYCEEPELWNVLSASLVLEPISVRGLFNSSSMMRTNSLSGWAPE